MNRVVSYSLFEDFIKKLAEFIDEHYLKQDKDISKLAFVFGGKRPSLFLKRELSRRIGKSFISPVFFSIDEFVDYILSKEETFSKIRELDACFTIYSLVKAQAPHILRSRDTFSKFLPWAREISSFIELLDLEDIPADSLKNIEAAASIGYEVPESINALLENVISVRDAYHSILKKNKTYSRGLMYLLAGKIVKDADFPEFDKVLFCSFFYLHKTEEEIITGIYRKDKALLFFQGHQKNWPVLKNLSERFSCRIHPEKTLLPEYNLSIHSGFDTHSQVCLVREVLKGIKNLDETVIVVPDANNIIPLLSEISSVVSEFNVSMGYPLKRSSICSLFEFVFEAQSTKKGDDYYTKAYLKVLSHPFIKNLRVLNDSSITRVLVHKIEEILHGIEKTSLGGSLFVNLASIRDLKKLYDFSTSTLKEMDIEVSDDKLRTVIEELHNLLFSQWENINNFTGFCSALRKFLDYLVRKSFLGNYPLNLRIVERMLITGDELENSVFSEEIFPQEEIFKIFDNKLANEMISFSGSPLKGLQILGLFETRSLNFENVVVMDVNESVLPKLRIYEPLIPRDVMLGLGLDRLQEEEEIQRYQFMRLISSAKNVYLVYQESEDKERSRFIEELIWDREKQSNSIDVIPVHRASFDVKVSPGKEEIWKTDDIVQLLRNFQYSATSINTYIHCPLRFYYKYVLVLKEKENLLKDPEGVDVGNFVHTLLEITFKKFVGSKPTINKTFSKYFSGVLNKTFDNAFRKRMKSDSFLLKEVLKFRLKEFLNNEKERDVEKILCLEETFKEKIELFPGEHFKFISKVDRIDKQKDGTILIIDYKTGSYDPMPKNADKIEPENFSREYIKKAIRSFQLPLYLYLAGKRFRDNTLNAALYYLRTPEIKYLIGEKDLPRSVEIVDVFMNALRFIVREILNHEVSFKANEEDIRYCANCPYFYLCR